MTEDIPAIAQSFIRRNNQKTGKKIEGITPEAMERIIGYPWPGNVRVLRNAIEYAFVLCHGGDIDARHLPPRVAGTVTACLPPASTGALDISGKRQALIRALKEAGGNRSKAARIFGGQPCHRLETDEKIRNRPVTTASFSLTHFRFNFSALRLRGGY